MQMFVKAKSAFQTWLDKYEMYHISIKIYKTALWFQLLIKLVVDIDRAGNNFKSFELRFMLIYADLI